MMNMQGSQQGPQGMPQGMQGMGMPPNGVAGLMNAPMPKQTAGVQALVPPLEGLGYQQLLMRLQNPAPTDSSWAIMTAMADALKKEQAAKAMAGQQAMQANAQQGPATVKDQLAMQAAQMAQQEQQPQQVAQAPEGGLMQMMRHGGFVQTFANGADEFGVLANPEAEAMDALRVERAQKEKQLKALEDTYYSLMMASDPRAVQVKQQIDALTGRSSTPVAPAAPTRLQDTRGGTPEMAQLAQMLGGAAPAPAPAAVTAQRRQPAPVSTPVVPQTATPADLPPTLLAAMKEREDQLRGRLTRPESLTKAEEGIAALARENIAAQRSEAEAFGREAREQRDAALARAQRSLFSDPQALFALAGSISGKRGETFGELGRSLSSQMGQRQESAEAARKEYALSQRDERAMQANIRQTQMLEAQRQLALEQGRMKDVNDINDQLSRLSIERENFRITRGDTAFAQAMEGRKVTAEERKARAAEISASKPDATVQLLQTLFPGQAPSVENLAKIAAAQYGPKLGAKEMTYDQASDNVQKLLDSTTGMMEVNAIKKRAKDAGQPEPSILDIKEMLIQRELRGAAARSGTSAAAPTGKIMTMADVQATATSSGKTVDEVKKAAIAAGYTIQ